MDDSVDASGDALPADPLAEPLARVLAGRTAATLKKAFGTSPWVTCCVTIRGGMSDAEN